MAALVAPAPRPVLTVLPGGRRQVTIDRDRIEEAWCEVQAVASDAELLAAVTLAAARRIQTAIAAERPAIAGQVAHELELAAPLHGYRAKRARLAAREAIDRIPDGVA